MRLAVICPHYGYIKRGTENMTYDINKILIDHDYDVDVFSLDKKADVHIESMRKDGGLGKLSNSFAEKSMLGGFMRKYIGITPHLEDVAFSLRAYRLLNKLHSRYDLLWSNGEIWEARLINKIRKKYKLPILVFFGGGISKMMLREAQMLPDIFVVLTPTMEEWVKRKVPECNVRCIPSGVDLKLFKKTTEMPDEMKDCERPFVLSTSALIESKRVDLIIKAMSELKHGTLFVTSDGPLRNTLVQLGKKLLKNRFKYLGVVPFESMPSLYSNADVYVMASRNEAYGAVLFEAMACGTPVIAQKDITREWMVGEGGVLLNDMSDTVLLAKTMEEVCKKEWYDKPRIQAEKFSWEKTVAGYERAIHEAIE